MGLGMSLRAPHTTISTSQLTDVQIDMMKLDEPGSLGDRSKAVVRSHTCEEEEREDREVP